MTTTFGVFGTEQINTHGRPRNISLADTDDHLICASVFGAHIRIWVTGTSAVVRVMATTDYMAYKQDAPRWVLTENSEPLEVYPGKDRSVIIIAARDSGSDVAINVECTDDFSQGLAKGGALAVGSNNALTKTTATYIDCNCPKADRDQSNLKANDLLLALVGVDDDGTIVPDLPDTNWHWYGGSASLARIYTGVDLTHPCLRLCYSVLAGTGSGNIVSIADLGGGEISIETDAAHGLKTGDYAHITGTHNTGYYDGDFLATYVDSTHFKVTHSFDSTSTGQWLIRYRWKDPAGSPVATSWGVAILTFRAEQASGLKSYGLDGPFQNFRNQQHGTTADAGWDPKVLPLRKADCGADSSSADMWKQFGNPICVVALAGNYNSAPLSIGTPILFSGSVLEGNVGGTKGGSVSWCGNDMVAIGFAVATSPYLYYYNAAFGYDDFAYQFATTFICLMT